MLRHVFTCFVVFLAWMILTVFVAWPGSPFLIGPILIVSGGVFLAAFLPFPKRQWSLTDMVIAVAIFGIFLGGVGAIRYAPNTRYNVAYTSIRRGMTLAEVEDVVCREIDFRAFPIQSNLNDGYVRLASPDSPDDMDDCINILMLNGRVAEIYPVPD